MDIRELHLLNLAALLHDIGKFAQRAGMPKSEGMEQEYCPHNANGHPTHLHVLHTDHFIEHDLPLPPELETDRARLARLASAHHRPDAADPLEVCLRDADWASSGLDRVEGESEDYKKARLESVFNVLALEHAPKGGLRHKLAAIDEDDAIFPVDTAAAGATDYAALWNGFAEDLGRLPLDMGAGHYLHSVQSLLEKWTWCIPSSTYRTLADISLFDHAYTTASVAQALHAFRTSGEKGKEYLLFGGDLSGIQDFIFASGENADKGAGKLLRARSFTVQMLTRSLWSTLLRRCGLWDTARIMDAGGRFLLLLPNTAAVSGHIRSFRRHAEEWLLKEYHGVIRAQFAQMELAHADLAMDRFQLCFDEFDTLLQEAKLRPFAALLENGISPLLGYAASEYSEYGACGVCGQAPADSVRDGRAICSRCRRFIEDIGARLPESEYAVLARKSDAVPDPAGFELFGGVHVWLTDAEPTAKARNAEDILAFKGGVRFTSAPVAGYVPRISQDELEKWKTEGRFSAHEGSLSCGGDVLRAGNAKTFSVLADLARVKNGNGWRSVPMLAALKADVDNLGLLFGVGFGGEGMPDIGRPQKRMLSVSRYAGLSRMMHRFFSSWLVRRVQDGYPGIYVVFAGGDDLFVLGPWSETVAFAEEMHDAFSRFSGSNADVTLSAGIALCKPGLPVFSIRNMAEDSLDRSKKHKAGDTRNDPKNQGAPGQMKNAVTLFGVTCGWDAFSEHMRTGERIERLCLEGSLSQGFVRRLLGDIAKGLYLSHMEYDMARNCDDKKLAGEDRRWLKELPHTKGFADMELAVTWALYRTRRS